VIKRAAPSRAVRHGTRHASAPRIWKRESPRLQDQTTVLLSKGGGVEHSRPCDCNGLIATAPATINGVGRALNER